MKQSRRSFLRNTALLSGAITISDLANRGNAITRSGVVLPGLEPEGGDANVREHFQSPPKEFRPLVRWWWPGDDVTEAELRREIGVLDQAGFGGAEIQAFFKGLDTKGFSEAEMRRVQGYASESFFRHVGVAADEARRHGMFIDYTFGSGWPFGGGKEITPELSSIELRSTHLSVEGPAQFHGRLQIPSINDGDPSSGLSNLKGLPVGWAERLKARTKLVAVVAARGKDAQWDFHHLGGPRQTVIKSGELESSASLDLTQHLSPDGVLSWEVPPGTWQLFVFCSVPTVQRVNGSAGNGPQLVMDHLNSSAFAAHAKRVGDNAIPFLGEYFGNGLRAVFCDSLEVSANLFWSDDFISEFRRRRGYDLMPYLPISKMRSFSQPYGRYFDLPVFEMNGIGAQVRHDYRQTVSDIMSERFYGEFNKWAHEHKLLSRTQAHGSPTDVMRVYGEADIPETEDLYDNGCYDFLKMAASAAHVYGRKLVGSESFVWPGGAYQTTPEKMKLAADELLTAGVNAIVYHGFPYIVPELPAPGWHPFNGYGDGNYSSQFNELNPFWPFVAQLNSYITRMQYISQTGRNVTAVALYRNDLMHGAEEQAPVPKLNQAMMDAGYNYDHINADSLIHSAVRDRTLVTAGGAHYSALVFPSLDAIDATLAETLRGFASGGLPILFEGQEPLRAEGFFEREQKTRRVEAAMQGARRLANVSVCSDIDELVSVLGKVANPNVRFRGGALPFMQTKIGGMNAFFLRNPSDAMHVLDAEFEAEGRPELWDPWTGKASAITSFKRKGKWVQVELKLQPFSSVLIVFDPVDLPLLATADAHARSLDRTEEIGGEGWKLIAKGMVASGKTEVIRRDLPQLIDWSLDKELRGFSGQGIYRTTFTVPASDAGKQIILDLGTVKNIAEISLNKKSVATLLLRPYEADITEFVQAGENVLEIAVTNALFNSMVLRDPLTFRPGPTENLSGLMSAGLMGPVQLKILS